MILRYIIWIFAIYALYRLIFDVIVPIARVSSQMKKKMREFQDNIHQQNSTQESFKQPKDEKRKTGDYIDFEELKS